MRATWDLISYAKYHTYSAVQASFAETNQDIGATGPTLEFDFRDHPFNPTRGNYTRMSTELGLPELDSSPNIRYTRTTALFTQFVNPIGRIVWANNITGGFLQNLMNGGYVPYDKKGFILGGPSTLRGFTNSEAFPNSKDFGGNTSYHLQTQAFYYLFKSEIRFPIKGNFGGAIFYEGGQVQLGDFYLPFGYRDAVGLAIRYNTPVGPISGEIGWKRQINVHRNENPFALNLSIGTF